LDFQIGGLDERVRPNARHEFLFRNPAPDGHLALLFGSVCSSDSRREARRIAVEVDEDPIPSLVPQVFARIGEMLSHGLSQTLFVLVGFNSSFMTECSRNSDLNPNSAKIEAPIACAVTTRAKLPDYSKHPETTPPCCTLSSIR
jgi:hypothetical protein